MVAAIGGQHLRHNDVAGRRRYAQAQRVNLPLAILDGLAHAVRERYGAARIINQDFARRRGFQLVLALDKYVYAKLLLEELYVMADRRLCQRQRLGRLCVGSQFRKRQQRPYLDVDHTPSPP